MIESVSSFHPVNGDIMVTERLLMELPRIVVEDPDGRRRIQIGPLSSYLRLLEMLVLHERILVRRSFDFEGIDEAALESPAIPHLWSVYCVGVNPLRLHQSFETRLENENILRWAELPRSYVTPRKYLDLYLPESAVLRRELERQTRKFLEYDQNHDRAVEVAKEYLTRWFGVPLAIKSAAAGLRVPFYLSREETQALHSLESENRVEVIGIIEEVYRSINAAPKELATEIKRLTGSCVFPATPIASQLIQEAKDPEDLINVAIQLRTEYKGLRQLMRDIDRAITDPDTPMRSRAKKVKELRMYLEELARPPGFFRVDTMAPAIISATLSAGEPVGALVTAVISTALKQVQDPFEKLKRLKARHSVRSALKSRKTFWRGRDVHAKIASIFSVTVNEVRGSVAEAEIP